MWYPDGVHYQVTLIVISVIYYWKESTISPQAKTGLNTARFLFTWGYLMNRLPTLLMYYDSKVLLDEEVWASSDFLLTMGLVLGEIYKYTGNRMWTVLAWCLLIPSFQILNEGPISIWREDCPSLVDRRLFKQDGNETYKRLLEAIVPLFFCNESSRRMMDICDTMLIKDLNETYRKHFHQMDYCATMPGMLVAETCVNSLLFTYYEREIKPPICLVAVRKEVIKLTNERLRDWESCFTNPLQWHCMVSQQNYREILQTDYNGTNPHPEMHWMIELEQTRALSRVRYSQNFTRSWQE
jgi:hypothetical protein